MSILLSSILLAAAAAAPQPAPRAASAPATDSKICRDMITSSSRLRPVSICKTKTAWQRWEKCHSATRYCAPPKRSTVQVASLPNDKLVCKYIKETGSRLGQQKVCATQRQWDVAEQETQEALLDRQNQSSLTSEPPPRPTRGGGPR